MVFSSVVFLFYYLPLLLAGYYLLPRTWLRNIFLFIASMLFYAWGEGKLLILLLIIGSLAWLFSFLIYKTRFRRFLVYTAVTTFILILVYYKYLGFIIDNFIPAESGGLSGLKFIMPLGISFFTFQAISYVLDVYRKNSRFEKNPAYLILYITMFPQLISGPLIRYHMMEPQLKSRSFDFSRFIDGIKRFIYGLAKKVLIANPIGLLVDQIFNTEIHLLGSSVAWIGIIAFTLQLFFDFSGYTDMAIGLGKMLGFDLPENFNFPYISRSISEFWRRWHMTLSSWLRDYVFMPLSMNLRRWRNIGVFIALMITFTLCGIWHNPGWNFIIWGAVHGFFLGIEQLFLGKYLARLKAFSVLYMLFIIVTSFVFVRAQDVKQALDYLGVMFTASASNSLGPESFLANQHIALIIVGILFCIPFTPLGAFKKKGVVSFIEILRIVFLMIIFLLSVMAMTSETYNPFLYFKF